MIEDIEDRQTVEIDDVDDRQTVETDRQTHLYLHLSIYPISSASLENPNTHTKTESLGVRIKNVYLTSFPSEPKLKKHLSNSL